LCEEERAERVKVEKRSEYAAPCALAYRWWQPHAWLFVYPPYDVRSEQRAAGEWREQNSGRAAVSADCRVR